MGNTTLLELRHVVPEGHARVLLKLEGENPTGSMKDRAALAMVDAAEADGRLQEGGNVVAALRVAERLGPEATVVSLMCDSGLKYLGTSLYKNA